MKVKRVLSLILAVSMAVPMLGTVYADDAAATVSYQRDGSGGNVTDEGFRADTYFYEGFNDWSGSSSVLGGDGSANKLAALPYLFRYNSDDYNQFVAYRGTADDGFIAVKSNVAQNCTKVFSQDFTNGYSPSKVSAFNVDWLNFTGTLAVSVDVKVPSTVAANAPVLMNRIVQSDTVTDHKYDIPYYVAALPFVRNNNGTVEVAPGGSTDVWRPDADTGKYSELSDVKPGDWINIATVLKRDNSGTTTADDGMKTWADYSAEFYVNGKNIGSCKYTPNKKGGDVAYYLEADANNYKDSKYYPTGYKGIGIETSIDYNLGVDAAIDNLLFQVYGATTIDKSLAVSPETSGAVITSAVIPVKNTGVTNADITKGIIDIDALTVSSAVLTRENGHTENITNSINVNKGDKGIKTGDTGAVKADGSEIIVSGFELNKNDKLKVIFANTKDVRGNALLNNEITLYSAESDSDVLTEKYNVADFNDCAVSTDYSVLTRAIPYANYNRYNGNTYNQFVKVAEKENGDNYLAVKSNTGAAYNPIVFTQRQFALGNTISGYDIDWLSFTGNLVVSADVKVPSDVGVITTNVNHVYSSSTKAEPEPYHAAMLPEIGVKKDADGESYVYARGARDSKQGYPFSWNITNEIRLDGIKPGDWIKLSAVISRNNENKPEGKDYATYTFKSFVNGIKISKAEVDPNVLHTQDNLNSYFMEAKGGYPENYKGLGIEFAIGGGEIKTTFETGIDNIMFAKYSGAEIPAVDACKAQGKTARLAAENTELVRYTALNQRLRDVVAEISDIKAEKIANGVSTDISESVKFNGFSNTFEGLDISDNEYVKLSFKTTDGSSEEAKDKTVYIYKENDNKLHIYDLSKSNDGKTTVKFINNGTNAMQGKVTVGEYSDNRCLVNVAQSDEINFEIGKGSVEVETGVLSAALSKAFIWDGALKPLTESFSK